MEHIVKILEIVQITHDVRCFRIEKPLGYLFRSGQATDVSINLASFEKELRPFTFTCLTRRPYLEFTIKRYPDHHGITDKIHELSVGDELIIHDPWGAIEYKGPGNFIAGGAGITPFIAIIRSLYDQNILAGNKLYFSNKTAADIIYEEELKTMLGENALFILSKEVSDKFLNGRIDKSFIEKYINDFGAHFYVCGPEPMIAAIVDTLKSEGANADEVIFEK